MPNPTVTVVGSYPRPPKEGGVFTLRKTLQALDRGEATLDDLEQAQDELVREVVTEQANAGVELVTDGQVRWMDGQTRFAKGLDGFRIGGLIRYFDNNTYYRQPEVIGEVKREEPVVVDEYRFAAAASPVEVKPVITGPYTLAVLSQDEHYRDQRALVRDLAVALNGEARDLAAAGATVIAFDEPALARVPGMPEPKPAVLQEAAALLVEGVEATTILQTYFGEVTLGEALFDLPFDGFGLDLIAGPANEVLAKAVPDGKVLQAGIVNARNTRVEELDAVVARIRLLSEAVPPERLWVSPSAGLEYLPREAAERKLVRLAEAAKEVRS
ncbi:MAG: methylcobamide--CoM methyltransferase [Actinomycetota bacterium]